jgi:tetratricopeptide (TPR) repeat protein
MIRFQNLPIRISPAGFARLAAVTIAGAIIWSTAPPMPAHGARGDLPTTRESEFGDQVEMVRRAQQSLKRMKFYDGPVDGRMSPAVRDAIKIYQRALGRNPTGKITRGLVDNMDTQEKVGAMLNRLQGVRQAKIDAARKALLERDETKGLLDDAARREVADPTRDASACFRDPTEKCLLHEAVESAKGVFKLELRDWAYGEILVSQAKAGLLSEAVSTVRRIGDARLIIVALRDIARAQAREGRIAESLETTKIIPAAFKRLEALVSVAEIQAEKGDQAGARTTARRAIGLLEELDNPLQRVTVLTQMAVILSKAGDDIGSQAAIGSAERLIGENPDGKKLGAIELGAALRHVASAYAQLGNPDHALRLLENVSGDYDRIAVLMSVAKAQANSGQTDAALDTAGRIETDRYQSVMIGQIAAQIARRGEPDKAFALVRYALSKTEAIDLPYAKSYATGQIVLSLIDIAEKLDTGAFERAIETSERIENNRLRAYALWSIARAQSRKGMSEGSRDTEARARRATDAIGSSLSRVWMLSDIATEIVRGGDRERARRTFDNALAIAKNIDNGWGRARALARLAAALHEIQ